MPLLERNLVRDDAEKATTSKAASNSVPGALEPHPREPLSPLRAAAGRRSEGVAGPHPGVPCGKAVRRLRRVGINGGDETLRRCSGMLAFAAPRNGLLPGPPINPGLSEHLFREGHPTLRSRGNGRTAR